MVSENRAGAGPSGLMGEAGLGPPGLREEVRPRPLELRKNGLRTRTVIPQRRAFLDPESSSGQGCARP